MPEMPNSRQHHGETVFVCCRNNLIIPDRPAGLYNGCYTGGSGCKQSGGKWKKGKGDLTPSAVKRRQKKRAADAPELTHTRQREMRGEGEVEYQDTIKY